MKICKFLLSSACVVMSLAPVAKADVIDNFVTSVTASDPTQHGRLSRNNNQPQDWVGSEAFPGVINTGTTYHYKTFTYDASIFTGGQYVQVTDTDLNDTANSFVSAYAGSYDPTNLQKNWLGDQGYGGNYIFGDGDTFQVILPSNQNLVLVMNETGTVLNSPMQIIVENFSDSLYDSPTTAATVTPEPSSLVLLGTGLVGALAAGKRRFRKAA